MAVAVARVKTLVPRLPGTLPAGTAGRMLEVGLALFAQHGFFGASIRDIGKALGLKPANLYDHFASKEHLLAEIVRLGHDEHLTMLRRALGDAAPGPVDQLVAVVGAHVRMHAEYAMLAGVANNEMHTLSRELAAPALALRAQSEALIMDVIERGVAAHLFDPPDLWLTGAAIGGMGMRVAHWYRAGEGLSIDRLVEVYVALALRMVGVRPPARRPRRKEVA